MLNSNKNISEELTPDNSNNNNDNLNNDNITKNLTDNKT